MLSDIKLARTSALAVCGPLLERPPLFRPDSGQVC